MPISPRSGRRSCVAPEEIVIELLGRRHLEAVHGDALRVDAAHHVADRPVLAGGVQRLQHHQHPPGVLSGQPRLVLRQQPHSLGEQGDPLLLLLHASLERRVEVLGEDHLRPRLHPERLDELRNPLLALVGHPQSTPSTKLTPVDRTHPQCRAAGSATAGGQWGTVAMMSSC